MRTFKVLSVLLAYPQAETLAALDDMAAIIDRETVLSDACKPALHDLIDAWRGADLLALQERYVELFDRGRFLSLHMFEHVHGESRDRGQAMVDLMQLYQSHGFEINVRELPDYIPLFLEFLSQLESTDQARQLLGDAIPVLSLLGARLAERGSMFQTIFDALADVAGLPDDIAAIRQQAASEGPDQTLADMDEIWEEEAVSFMAAGEPCTTQTGSVKPVTMKPRDQIRKSPPGDTL